MVSVNSELCSDDIMLAETFPHTPQKNNIASFLIYPRYPSVYLNNYNPKLFQGDLTVQLKSMNFLPLADY